MALLGHQELLLMQMFLQERQTLTPAAHNGPAELGHLHPGHSHAPSHLPGGHSGVNDACDGAVPMSLSWSLSLTFRGFCLKNEQGHLSIPETRGQLGQVGPVLLCSAPCNHIHCLRSPLHSQFEIRH